jgi:signal transduction histidine kinase
MGDIGKGARRAGRGAPGQAGDVEPLPVAGATGLFVPIPIETAVAPPVASFAPRQALRDSAESAGAPLSPLRGPANYVGGLAEMFSHSRRAATQLFARAPRRDLGFTLRLSRGRVVFDEVGEGVAAKLGLRPGDLIGREVAEALVPVMGLRMEAAALDCAATGRVVRWMQPAPTPRGRRLWRLALTPVRTHRGAVNAIHGLIRETPSAIEARNGARREGCSAENAPNVFYLLGLPKGELAWMSPEIAGYAGLPDSSPAEIMASSHPEDMARMSVLHDVGSPCTLVADTRLRRKDGTYRNFRLTADLVQGFAGHRWYGMMVETERGEAHVESHDAAVSTTQDAPTWRLVIDRERRITAISPEILAYTGLSPDQVIGQDVRERLKSMPQVCQALEDGLAHGGEVLIVSESLGRRSGLVECRIQAGRSGAVAIFRGVDDHRQDDGAMDPPEHLRGLTDVANAQMLLLDDRGSVLSVNEAYRALAGRAAGPGAVGLTGQGYLQLCRRFSPEVDTSIVGPALEQLASGRIHRFVHTFVRSVGDTLRLIRIRITPLQMGGATRLIVLQEDLTDFARTEAALKDTTEQLLKAQQEERQRIAIELHDSTSQHLAAVGLGIAKLRRIMGGRLQVQEVLDDVSRSLEEATKEIRVLSYLMKPAALERNGLSATAEIFVRGFGRRTGLNTGFRMEGAIDAISPDVAHACFRVLQEALSNVYRHAEASGVEVELANRDGSLTVRIADDGKGIAGLRSGDESRIGVGIAGMRVRVDQLGGDLDISCDGAGTVVAARLPAYAEQSASSGSVR